MSDDILAQILARLAMIEAGQTELRAALLALTAGSRPQRNASNAWSGSMGAIKAPPERPALGSLLVVVTGVVMAALRYWLLHHCPDCGIPI